MDKRAAVFCSPFSFFNKSFVRTNLLSLGGQPAEQLRGRRDEPLGGRRDELPDELPDVQQDVQQDVLRPAPKA
jgi:hypothetical protein